MTSLNIGGYKLFLVIRFLVKMWLTGVGKSIPYHQYTLQAPAVVYFSAEANYDHIQKFMREKWQPIFKFTVKWLKRLTFN